MTCLSEPTFNPKRVTESHQQSWFRPALLVGIVYFAVGRLFSVPITHAQEWRWAAWIVSGVAFAAHIGYEHFKTRHLPGSIARDAAVAVAIGAFLLAVAGMIYSVWVTSALRPAWLLAFVLWPAFTAIPAFLVALVVATLLKHLRLRTNRANR